jgi:hypothetical protein
VSDQTQTSGPTLQAVQAELLRATQQAATDFCAQNGTMPMEGMAKAALEFAQAYVILNPTMGPQGVPLQHEVNMANLQAAHAAKAAAAAPSPAKGAKP